MTLLGNLKGSAHVFPETAFYNGVATQSLRLDNSASSLLTRTPSAGDRKTWTWSAWIKRCDTGRDQDFFTAEGSGAQLFAIMIIDGDKIQIYGVNSVLLLTNQLLRDTSAWYNIVVKSDTTQGTATDRLKLYLNGSEVTSFGTDNRANYAQNTDYGINSNVKHNIGSNQAGGNFGDYYIAEVNFVDGTAYDASYFGETKNGVWIPKKYTGSYGTQGFHLEFKQTGDGSSTASSSTIGADTSGNGNHYKDTNLDAHDSNMPDSPENNFCTFNPIGRRYGQSYTGTFSEGNLKVASGGNATHVFGTMAINQIASQGGVYFEVRLDSQDTSRTYVGVFGDTGANNKASNSNAASYSFSIKGLLRPSAPDGSMASYFGTDTDGSGATDLSSHVSTYSNGDILGVAILSDGKTFFHKNGTYIDDASGNVGNPSTGANPAGTIDLTKGDFVPYVGYNSTFSINFGQDSTFAGQESSGGNSDANGIGDFAYAVPTNCLALCTSNIAEPTIGPNSATQADDHFNTVLYTGDGSGQSITGVGFQPDWTWIKSRSHASSHVLTDSSRGVTKSLFSDTNGAEQTLSGGVTAFGTDGFTLGSEGTVNTSSRTYVAWNWKANGGTTSSNSDGSLTSTVQANTTAGLSVITYTGGGSAGDTIGHGLNSAPEQVWFKRRGDTGNWMNYVKAMGNDGYINLDRSNGKDTGGSPVNSTDPSSSVITLGSFQSLNGNTNTYVAYAFHSVEGYSKFGSYNGNGNADGPFVFTGFRPAWVLIKNTARSADWRLHDIARQPINDDGGHILLPNSSSSEVTNEYDIDFLSNGFKLRSGDVYENGDGELLIYAAFAEDPFKYANAK